MKQTDANCNGAESFQSLAASILAIMASTQGTSPIQSGPKFSYPKVAVGEKSARQLHFDHLEWLAYWLDEGFRIPTTGIRFGWDAIAKIVPVFGDVLGLIASLYLFHSLRRLNLPRVTRVRMITNIAIDYLIGLLPLIGVVFDVYWKPNVWNVALARRHLSATTIDQTRRARLSDWLFVVAAVVIVIVLLAASIAACYWLLLQVSHLLTSVNR